MNTRTALFFLLLPLAAAAGELTSTAKDQADLSLTIYNNDLALVRETRQVKLPAGEVTLALREVSGKMQPETALLKAVDNGEPLEIIEQNFDYNLLTPRKLLEMSLGREIGIARTNPATGKETVERSKVLSTQQGLVVRIGDRIETNPGGRYIFDNIPPKLRDKPTLATRLSTKQGGNRALELSYLSAGLSWRADYVGRLDKKDRHMALAGWVTLTNNSETDYHNARLQLVAGQVNRVVARQPIMERRVYLADAPAQRKVREEPLLAYHLYTLPRKTTLLDRQTKQVAFLTADEIPVEKKYRVTGSTISGYAQTNHWREMPVAVYLSFRNDTASNLGLPLPAGILRIYREDSHGDFQFVGEDRIRHTPRDESVRTKLGNAFDITARQIQTYWKKRVPPFPYKNATESGHRIVLHNAGKQTVDVIVTEHLDGDWKIPKENLRHGKLNSSTAQWVVKLPPGGKKTLEYQVLTKW